MPTTISRQTLSGSTNGRGVKVAATSTPGTTIHTAHATAMDEVYIWASNTDTTDRKLTIEFGGTTAPDDLIEFTVPAETGAILVVNGLTLTNSLVVKAFCATADVVICFGYVNRITNG